MSLSVTALTAWGPKSCTQVHQLWQVNTSVKMSCALWILWRKCGWPQCSTSKQPPEQWRGSKNPLVRLWKQSLHKNFSFLWCYLKYFVHKTSNYQNAQHFTLPGTYIHHHKIAGGQHFPSGPTRDSASSLIGHTASFVSQHCLWQKLPVVYKLQLGWRNYKYLIKTKLGSHFWWVLEALPRGEWITGRLPEHVSPCTWAVCGTKDPLKENAGCRPAVGGETIGWESLSQPVLNMACDKLGSAYSEPQDLLVSMHYAKLSPVSSLCRW